MDELYNLISSIYELFIQCSTKSVGQLKFIYILRKWIGKLGEKLSTLRIKKKEI